MKAVGIRIAVSMLAWSLLVLPGCRTTGLVVKGGGVGFLFRVESPKQGGTQAMADVVRKRLEALGVNAPTVVAEGEDRIRVLVPDLGESEADRFQGLLTRPTQVAFSLVDDGKEFFEALKNKLPGDGSVTMATETSRRSPEGPPAETCYLMATHRKKMEAFLKSVNPPEGRRLWILPGEWGVLAYLIEEPPTLRQPVVENVTVVTDEGSGQAAVELRFAKEHQVAFAELTRKNINRRLAILVDGEIRSIPVIQSAIESGRARIGASPITPVGVTEREARSLAAGIKAWGLAGGLSLIERCVTLPPRDPAGN
jgi:SecD/SecF fusion protein